MTVENFIKRFDEVVDGTPGINRIRKLILRLATTGRLIPTDDKGWEKISLNQIASVRMGKTILKNELSASGIPVYSAGRENSAWGYVTESDLTFRAGTIVVSARGTIGFPKIPAESVFISTQTTIAITPTSTEIDPGYFCLQLQTVDWDRLTAKTAIPMITVKQVNAIDVRYPHSHAEQKRIVAKVDELMALCDRLEAQLKERDVKQAALAKAALAKFTEDPTPENLQLLFHPSFSIEPEDLSEAVLMLGFRGDLSRTTNNSESADTLLESIKAEQKLLVDKREIRKPDLSAAGESPVFTIPKNWTWTKLGQIGDWGSGSTPSRSSSKYYGGDMPWLKSGELNDNKAISVAEEHVTAEALKECSFRLNKTGDVLLAMYGATIGKAGILSKPAVTNQAVCGCTPFSGVNNEFLFYYLVSRRSHFHDSSEGGAQPNISKVKIVNHPFPLPPLEEQKRVVERIKELLGLIDQLKGQIESSRITGEKLLEAMVAELTSA